MTGKKGIVFGVANDRSYAWYIAQALKQCGAEMAFSYLPIGKSARRVNLAVKELGIEDPFLIECDVTKDEDLDATFDKLAEEYGSIDFVVHSVAFADKTYLEVGRFKDTPRDVWAQALDVSAYSLVAMAQRAAKIMPNGGGIVSMSYLGGEKAVPGYNVMGVAKAALEHSTRYLALELGAQNIRVNSISGGPLRTLAAMGVGGFAELLDHSRQNTPLQRNIEGEEVGQTAAFLLSKAAGGITGEIIHVDSGQHILTSTPSRKDMGME